MFVMLKKQTHVRMLFAFALVFSLVFRQTSAENLNQSSSTSCDDFVFENTRTMEEMSEKAKEMTNFNCKTLNIFFKNFELPFLPPKLLSHLNSNTKTISLYFQDLKLQYLSIPEKPETPFDGAPPDCEIANLHIKNVDNLMTWDWKVFENLCISVGEVEIKDSFLYYLKSSISDGLLRRTTTLKIKNCNLQWLDEGALNGDEALTSIDISDNNIKGLSRKMFGNKLYSLKLQANQITELPEDIFEGMGELRHVLLDSNNLKTLHPKILQFLGDLGDPTAYEIKDNPFDCDSCALTCCLDQHLGPDVHADVCSNPTFKD